MIMSRYRRNYVQGASYFFTVNLAWRNDRLLIDQIDLLRGVFARVTQDWPVTCDAMVVLPDHLHAVWTLPVGDSNYSERWRLLKYYFSRDLGQRRPRSDSKIAKRECGVWQRRFWEHTIRDEADYAMHVRYCWSNPVKHGFVKQASDWPYSSIHRDIRAGHVDPEWAGILEDGTFGER